MADLLAAAAPQGHQRPSRHGGGRADLRLTAAGSAGDARPIGDDRADTAGHIQRLQQLVLAQLLVPAQGQQHRRQHAAGARRRRRHDAAHTGVGLRHGQRLGDDLADVAAGHGFTPQAVLPHFHAVTAHQAADALAPAGVAVRRIGHGLPGDEHLRHGLVARHLALVHIRLQHDLPEGLALLLHAVKYFLHRIQSHRHPPPCRSRSWTARPAARTETPPGWA